MMTGDVKSRAQLTAQLWHSQLPWMPARKYGRLCEQHAFVCQAAWHAALA